MQKNFFEGKILNYVDSRVKQIEIKKKLCVTKWEKMLLYLGTANNNLSITQILKLLEE